MIDSGLLVYAVLTFLFVWRMLCPWRCCGIWLQYANYASLLYFALFIDVVYNVAVFYRTVLGSNGPSVWLHCNGWMKPVGLLAPVAICVTLGCCFAQTITHIRAIRRGKAPLKHDRVVQILALPVVYGAMAMSNVTRFFELSASGGADVFNISEASMEKGDRTLDDALSQLQGTTLGQVQLAISKSETAFMVADLYEAWALYQFLKLTLELLAHSASESARDATDAERRGEGRTIVKFFSAIESLSWMGVIQFLVVTLLMAGWSLYLLVFAASKSTWEEWNEYMAQFKAAGTIASFAAIWNVHIVESRFHGHLGGFFPLMKFVTVKILVSIAFFQRYALSALKVIDQNLPDLMRKIVAKMPVLGDMVHMSLVEFELFYASLIVFECVLVAGLHWLAWGASEEWYGGETGDGSESAEEADGEKQPLVAKSSK